MITHADFGMQNVPVSSTGFEITKFFAKQKCGMVSIHFLLFLKDVSQCNGGSRAAISTSPYHKIVMIYRELIAFKDVTPFLFKTKIY
jgi:hypothetical protein